MAVIINNKFTNPSILDQSESNLVVSKEMIRYFGLPEDYIQLFVYNNTNTFVDFANIASGYCTIYWTSPLTGLVVHLRPINTY